MQYAPLFFGNLPKSLSNKSSITININLCPFQFQQQKLLRSISQTCPTQDMTQPVSPSQQKASYLFGKLYQSHHYFSPYHISTQEQLIQDIQSLADQILFFQDESLIIQQKKQRRQFTRGYHGSLESKPSHSQKSKITKKQKIDPIKVKLQKKHSPQIIKNPLKPVPKREILTTKILRQRTVQKLNRSKEQQLKASQAKSPLAKPQTPKPKLKSKISQSPKFLQNLEYDYRKLIDQNIPKIVNELKCEKQVLQPSNGQKFKKETSKKVSNPSILNSTHRSKEILTFTQQHSLVSSRQKLNQTFSTLYTNSRTMLQKKQEKIQNYKEEMFKKEMQEATFEPKRFTLSYKPKSTYVSQSASLKGFYHRQRIAQETRSKRQLQKLTEIMEEFPFKPRLNTRQAESVVKEIWRSSSKETRPEGKQQIQKISDRLSKMTQLLKKDHERLSQAQRENVRANQQTVEIAVANRNQVNFLLE